MLGKSPHFEFANSTTSWFSIDSEEFFNSNMENPDRIQKMQNLGWKSDSITYTFNSHGFRSDSFDGDGALFLGCSFTFGTGMIWERTWAYLTAKELNLKCWNLGVNGGSNDTAFRLATYWIPELKPKYVFYLPTQPHRVEIFTPDKIENLLPMVSTEEYVKLFYNKWLSSEYNGILNFDKNVRGIKSICEENAIECFVLGIDNRPHGRYEDCARDILHPGVTWNKDISSRFLEKMQRIT